MKRPDVNVVRIDQRGAVAAGDLLDTLRKRIEAKRGLAYPGRGVSPSSGWLAVFLAIQLCESVDVYGIGLGGCWGAAGGGCWRQRLALLRKRYGRSLQKFSRIWRGPSSLLPTRTRHAPSARRGWLHQTPRASKYDSLEKEASHLRATQPKVLGAAQSTARALSARADLICIASVGQTCGCEKRVFGAERKLHSEKKSKMKEATQVIKSVESHSDDAGHDDDDDENGGGNEAEER